MKRALNQIAVTSRRGDDADADADVDLMQMLVVVLVVNCELDLHGCKHQWSNA